MAGPEHERGIPADEWIRRIDKAGEEALIPGDPNRTAELLKRIRESPDPRPKPGRPPGSKNTKSPGKKG